MKFKIKLLEASNMSEYDKMREFENGTRRENVKACGDDKLFRYQKICKDNNFKNALAKIEAEMQNRGILSNNTATSTTTTATVASTSIPTSTLSTSGVSTNTNSSIFLPISKLLDTYESLIPKIMNTLRQAKSEDQLKSIANELSAYPDLIILYLLIAVLSEYLTAQTIFRKTIKTEYGISPGEYISTALDEPRVAELRSKYNLIMY